MGFSMECDPTKASLSKATQEHGAIEPQTIKLDAQEECSLFRLSPEIRNIIYGYAFGQKIYPEDHAEAQRVAISLAAVGYYAPSNELLRTCHRIHNESRGMFVKAQRDFWKDNAFAIELKDDWGNAPVDTNKGMETSDLREAQLELIPRIVIDVETKTTSCQYNFAQQEKHLLGCTLDLDTSTATTTDLKQMVIMEVSAYIRYFKDVVRYTKEAHLLRDYLDSAWTYHKSAVRRGENVKNADHMLRKIADKLRRVACEILGLTAKRKTAFLKAIIKHCLDSHNATEKPGQHGD